MHAKVAKPNNNFFLFPTFLHRSLSGEGAGFFCLGHNIICYLTTFCRIFIQMQTLKCQLEAKAKLKLAYPFKSTVVS